MFHFFLTMITDIIISLRFDDILCFAAIIVVLMLFSSPGAVATILGAGAKLGTAVYMMNGDDKEA